MTLDWIILGTETVSLPTKVVMRDDNGVRYATSEGIVEYAHAKAGEGYIARSRVLDAAGNLVSESIAAIRSST